MVDDIRLIAILPTQTVQSVQQSPAAEGITTQSPTISVNLPTGSILSGFIVNRDPQGNPVLRTDQGDVTFSTNFFLKIGSEVVIRVENQASNTRAHILSVNGQPPEVAEQQSSFAQEPEVIVGRNQTSQPQGNQAQAAQNIDTIVEEPGVPTTITGTVLSPPPPSTGSPPQPTLPEGTQVTLKLVTITVPPQEEASATATAATATPTTTAQPAASAQASTAYARIAATGITPTINTPPTQTVSVPQAPVTTVPPAIPTANTTIPQIPQTPETPVVQAQTVAPKISLQQTTTPVQIQEGQNLQASVLGKEPTGEVVVQTQAGIIRLQAGTVLPQNSQAIFEVIKIALPDLLPASTPQTTAPAPLTELAQQWSSLQDIFSLLSANVGQDEFSPMMANMPWLLRPDEGNMIPPQNMPVGLMVFIAALRGGDFRNWLGEDNTRWLESNGHEALLKKAEGDFVTMTRPFTQATPGQWQPVFFPLVVAGHVEQIRLYVKRDPKKGGKDSSSKKGEDTRFVLEMDLSQLGEMQMDGFVRKRDSSMEFDLFIRSLTPLSQEIQRDILAIYTKTGELTGYNGQLLFQSVREFPVNPMEELIAEHIKSVIV